MSNEIHMKNTARNGATPERRFICLLYTKSATSKADFSLRRRWRKILKLVGDESNKIAHEGASRLKLPSQAQQILVCPSKDWILGYFFIVRPELYMGKVRAVFRIQILGPNHNEHVASGVVNTVHLNLLVYIHTPIYNTCQVLIY